MVRCFTSRRVADLRARACNWRVRVALLLAHALRPSFDVASRELGRSARASTRAPWFNGSCGDSGGGYLLSAALSSRARPGQSHLVL
eukprot:6187779-Pleurochrysis_carterae.AAC.5